ncbi:hypothetical protein B566_EDAN002456 [Ephemera danica]|nr:hypothetical protein B566_EDAN002456 [Ephemera danica]
MLERLRNWLAGRKLAVDCLAAAFGVGSWVAVNGLWVELPFAESLFRSVYLPSYLLGEGLSALLPSLVAVGQGVGKSQCVNSSDPEYPGLVEQLDPPRFSTEVFFVTLAVMMLMSALAFSGLELLPLCHRERVAESEEEKKRHENVFATPAKHGFHALWYLLALQVWMCFWSNGVLVSLQTYSCLPYGNGAYHWAAILFNAANPLACLVALYRPLRSLPGLGGLVSAGSLVAAYLLWTAGTSPTPPLVGTSAGGPVVVTAWFLYSALTSYAKVSVACVLRQSVWKRSARDEADATRTEAESRLFMYGVATQSGSLVGSVITFVLVNVVVIFTAAYPCSTPQ